MFKQCTIVILTLQVNMINIHISVLAIKLNFTPLIRLMFEITDKQETLTVTYGRTDNPLQWNVPFIHVKIQISIKSMFQKLYY